MEPFEWSRFVALFYLMNITDNVALSRTDKRGGEVPIWSTIPSSSQTRLLCGIAEWWWTKVQSRELAHTTNTTMSTPCSWGRDSATSAVVCTKAWNRQSSDRQSTNRNTLLVSLYALQATRLIGHSVMTDFVYIYLICTFIYSQTFCDM